MILTLKVMVKPILCSPQLTTRMSACGQYFLKAMVFLMPFTRPLLPLTLKVTVMFFSVFVTAVMLY